METKNPKNSGTYIWQSLLITIIGIIVAALDFLFMQTQGRMVMIIFSVIAVIGLWSIVYNILKLNRQLAVQAGGTSGTGRYLKHITYAMDLDAPYWELHYSYTDENGVNREAKSLIDNKNYVFALKQAGEFPVKMRGKYAAISVDEQFIKQAVGQYEEAFIAETVNSTAEGNMLLRLAAKATEMQ